MFITAIVTIRKAITPRCVENTFFGAAVTWSPIWILYLREVIETLALAKGEFHITAVLTQWLVYCATGRFYSNATTIVTAVEIRTMYITIWQARADASNGIFVTPICTILDAITDLTMTIQTLIIKAK